jgi:hypothetical protein
VLLKDFNTSLFPDADLNMIIFQRFQQAPSNAYFTVIFSHLHLIIPHGLIAVSKLRFSCGSCPSATCSAALKFLVNYKIYHCFLSPWKLLYCFGMAKLQPSRPCRLCRPGWWPSMALGCDRVEDEGAQEKIDQKWPPQTSDQPNPEILTVNPQRFGLNYKDRCISPPNITFNATTGKKLSPARCR